MLYVVTHLIFIRTLWSRVSCRGGNMRDQKLSCPSHITRQGGVRNHTSQPDSKVVPQYVLWYDRKKPKLPIWRPGGYHSTDHERREWFVAQNCGKLPSLWANTKTCDYFHVELVGPTPDIIKVQVWLDTSPSSFIPHFLSSLRPVWKEGREKK